jgi:hypothetical protein
MCSVGRGPRQQDPLPNAPLQSRSILEYAESGWTLSSTATTANLNQRRSSQSTPRTGRPHGQVEITGRAPVPPAGGKQCRRKTEDPWLMQR